MKTVIKKKRFQITEAEYKNNLMYYQIFLRLSSWLIRK